MEATVAALSARRIHPAEIHVQRWDENGAAPAAVAAVVIKVNGARKI